MDEVIPAEDEWYVAARAPRTEETPLVIKSGDTFALFDRFGDIQPGGSGEQGLYHEDTRYLSRLELFLDDAQPMFLGAAVKEGSNVLVVDLMNPDLMRDGEPVLRKGELHVFRAKMLCEGICYEHIRLGHHGLEPVRLSLKLRFDADFADLFEVRGARRERRGTREPTQRQASELVFGYEGLDRRRRQTRVWLDPPPAVLSGREARYDFALQPHQEVHLYCTVGCEIEGGPQRQVLHYDAAYLRNREARAQQQGERCRISTSNPLLDRWLDRSTADLEMLSTDLPSGPYPYAGVPWYSTTFGRDGLITARETLWVDPALARGVLAHLAALQAGALEPERDAEPGKILHEARKCEMAHTGEVPFARYYGTVDATPLFVALAGAYHRRTGDTGFIRAIWPNVLAALRWIDEYGDVDRDGFVEYARRSRHGLVQQGWKDSHDSVFHADGTMAEAPIALAEVQGYVYEAKQMAAELAQTLGEPELAERLRDEARTLRRRFQQQFWCDELGCYAIALDGHKRPCRVATSNAGHALWTGIASPQHAARMAQRLMEPDFFTGWGIRTVAQGQARYNPMSYHNGSVWPHDTALIAEGLARYRHTEAAMRLLTALFEASLHFGEHRLPELFCGFPRREGEGPTLYPVACSPQAWAAGSVFAMLRACLGLEIDAVEGSVSLHAPRLPEYVGEVQLRDLRVGNASVDLLLKRYANNVGVEVGRRNGDVQVQVSV